MAVDDHRRAGGPAARVFVLTVSDTRDEGSDTSGAAIAELVLEAGHTIAGRQIVRDEPAEVQRIVRHQLAEPAANVIVTTGGTGISSRDSTFEAVAALLQKRLDGFGELFRMLSYQEIGSAAMLSRACAGATGGKLVFVLPGSEHAVRLAVTKLILPEMIHLLHEVSR